MDSLVVPCLDTLRRWLDEIGISFLSAIPVRHCTCRICRISTVFLMPKLTGGQRGALFRPAEVKPSALLALSADLGHQRQLVNREGVYRHSGR